LPSIRALYHGAYCFSPDDESRVIRDALGLPGANTSYDRKGKVNIERDIIIEAELVAFSDVSGRVDGRGLVITPDSFRANCGPTEFWRIRSLIESTSAGPRRHRIHNINNNSQAE
jgi:hypothetical protein